MIWQKNLRLFQFFLILSCGAFLCTNVAEAQLDFDGALGIWLLDEGKGGDIEDISGNDNGGAFAHGKPKWVAGKFGKALEFEQDSWVAMNNPVVTVDKMVDFSMGCWANPENSQKTWTNILSSHQEPPRRGISFEMLNNETNLFGIAIGDGPNWFGAGNVLLKTGVWNHMAFVRTGKTGQWFLNGKNQGKYTLGSDKPVVAATSNFRIGNWVLGGREFNGKVDESFLFSRALDAEEIEAIFEKGLENAQAVTSKGKFTTTWGKIKSWNQ
ncbi:MAG: LamG domain-containing protein [Candidatus Poribacteria bacterium]|nr:LamG domain-containing protein [Candidatus Poribacteria bacterium]